VADFFLPPPAPKTSLGADKKSATERPLPYVCMTKTWDFVLRHRIIFELKKCAG